MRLQPVEWDLESGLRVHLCNGCPRGSCDGCVKHHLLDASWLVGCHLWDGVRRYRLLGVSHLVHGSCGTCIAGSSLSGF